MVDHDKENPIPDGIEVETLGGATTIKRRWYSGHAWVFLFFTIAFSGGILLRLPDSMPSDAGYEFLKIIVLFTLILSAIFSYATLALFFNKTKITAGNGMLVIRHGPLPTWGNKSIAASQIRQLFCDEVRTWNRNNHSVKYRLNAVLADNQKKVLIGGQLERDQALYIERITENALGIKPKGVVGELN